MRGKMLLLIGAAAFLTGAGAPADYPAPPGFKGTIARTADRSVPDWPSDVKPPAGAPNILVWMIDDLGFAQLGSYGGLIDTPTLDRLADTGLRYTDFNSTAICAPTRASFLSGRNHHAIGLGFHSKYPSGYPGYNGRVPPSAASLAKVLQKNGYATFALGKWDHLIPEHMSLSGPFDNWPSGQGFDHFYGFMDAVSSQFDPVIWQDHGFSHPQAGRPDYYLTTDIADKAIEWIAAEKSITPDKPFFMYWATGAVHDPNHATPEYIAKYEGRFDMGWDEARRMILARQIKAGVMPADTDLPPLPEGLPAWNSLSPDEKAIAARQMEVFAAMLDQADHEFGRIVDTLRRTGQLDNTIIVVMSDNGASADAGISGSDNIMNVANGRLSTLAELAKKKDDWGSKKVEGHYAMEWAIAGNTPLQYYKRTVHAGGTRVPLIISWPAKLARYGGQVRPQFQHVTDIMPTLLAMARIAPPESVDGVPQQRLDGVDMTATFAGPTVPSQKRVQYFEMFGNRGIYADGWKAVTLAAAKHWDQSKRSAADDHWELYHVDTDFNETDNVAAKYPGKLKEMIGLFDREARANHVYPLLATDSKARQDLMWNEAMAKNNGHYVFYGPGGYIAQQEQAPPFPAYSHTITAEFAIEAPNAEGVMIAYGDATGGFSLYLQDGCPVYSYNIFGDQIISMTGPRLGAGRHKLVLEYRKDGDTAKAQLTADGSVVATADLPGPMPRIMATAALAIGWGPSVRGRYDTPFKFTGTLDKVSVDIVKP